MTSDAIAKALREFDLESMVFSYERDGWVFCTFAWYPRSDRLPVMAYGHDVIAAYANAAELARKVEPLLPFDPPGFDAQPHEKGYCQKVVKMDSSGSHEVIFKRIGAGFVIVGVLVCGCARTL